MKQVVGSHYPLLPLGPTAHEDEVARKWPRIGVARLGVGFGWLH